MSENLGIKLSII